MFDRRVAAPGFLVIRGNGASDGIASMFPDGVVAALALGDIEPDPLFPEEAALIAEAVKVRRVEFARGRSCARRAMAEFDVILEPILADARRAPVWPHGVTGSISHCHGFCCAVVGRSNAWIGLGIDVELLRPFEDGVQQIVLTSVERAHLQRLDPSTPWACVIFAIKEAIYKLWYAVTRSWLGFEEVTVTLNPDVGRFEADLSSDASTPSWLRRLEGRFCIDGRFTLATVALAVENRRGLTYSA